MEQSYVIRNDRVIGKTVPNVNYNYSTCPIGSIFAFSSERIPLGFCICDGTSYKVAEYPDLYAVIGNTYGGDSENFNVPDFRETVLVGVGENTNDTITHHDIYELGEFKDDQIRSHTHDVTIPNMFNGSWNVSSSGSAGYSSGTKTQTSTVAGIGAVTHGKQKGVIYIIKAFHTNEGLDSNEVTDQIIEYVEGEIAEVESKINPTIDISEVFSNGALNIATLCSTYGNGRYVIVGQGTAGNGSATIDIWTLASHAISYIVNVTYSNKTSNTFIGLTYENPTINFEASYLSACNHIAKVCTLV